MEQGNPSAAALPREFREKMKGLLGNEYEAFLES